MFADVTVEEDDLFLSFIEMVSQEYYLRVFQDVFDEIFSSRVDHLAVTLAKERSK